MLSQPEDIFTYQAKRNQPGSEAQSVVLTRRDFAIPEQTLRQVLFEVYFESQFYDLELLVESKDASEVRAHYYSGQHGGTDITKFKGAKRVFIEAEPGDYTLEVIAKLPPKTKETESLNLKYIEFQMYIVAAENLPSRVHRPPSLNYFGLLGPKGSNFG